MCQEELGEGQIPQPQETSYQLSHILVLSQNVKELGRRAKHLLPGEGEMCGCSAGYLRIEVIEILIFQGLHLKRLLVM